MSSLPVPATAHQDIDSTLRENRVFPPPPEFSAKAYIKSLDEYEALYKQSIEDPESFWGGAAKELHWFKPWDKVLEWNLPWAKWFVGGKMNLSYNCVDRHALGARAGQDRDYLGGRAGRGAPADLCGVARGGAEVRQCAEGAGNPKGRPRGGLYGHDAGAGHCVAGLRAHRRGALGDLWRICGQRHCRPRERLGVRGHSYPGLELPARKGDPAQGHGGRGHERLPHGEARGGLPAHRLAGEHGGRPRPLVARPDGKAAPNARPRSWIRKIRSTSSTPRAPPASPRDWCTLPAATRCRLT